MPFASVLALSVFHVITSHNRVLSAETQCTAELGFLFFSSSLTWVLISMRDMRTYCISQEPPHDFQFQRMGKELSCLFPEVRVESQKIKTWIDSLSSRFIFGFFLFITLNYSVSFHISSDNNAFCWPIISETGVDGSKCWTFLPISCYVLLPCKGQSDKVVQARA